MTARLSAQLVLDAGDHIGEGPVWDEARERLLWVDHAEGLIHEGRVDGFMTVNETRRWNLDRALAAIVPCATSGFLCATGVEFYRMDEAGALELFASLGADPVRVRLNDAKCDRAGRLWTGTLATDFGYGAALHRLDPDGSVHTMLDGLRLANGLDWSPDSRTFYLIDSLDLAVDAFDFHLADGTLRNRRRLIEIARGDGGANGMTVDDEGCLWVALTGGGEVRRYSPAGEQLLAVELPIPGPTSCAFGGPDRSTLFITSRSGRMPEVAATVLGIPEHRLESSGPGAGGLWAVRPGVSGPPAAPFGV
jgi:sugar lactone lactonase YvrE